VAFLFVGNEQTHMSDRKKTTLTLGTKRKPKAESNHGATPDTSTTTPAKSPTSKTLGLTRKRRLVLPITEETQATKKAPASRNLTADKKIPAWKKKSARKIVVQNIDKPRLKSKTNPVKKPKKPKKPAQPTIKKTPPSTLKANALDEWLQQRFVTWRTYQPLVIGVHKSVIQLVGREQLPYSKRVIQKVLAKHTRHENYQANLAQHRQRVPLDA
jgi:hypothetical protein